MSRKAAKGSGVANRPTTHPSVPHFSFSPLHCFAWAHRAEKGRGGGEAEGGGKAGCHGPAAATGVRGPAGQILCARPGQVVALREAWTDERASRCGDGAWGARARGTGEPSDPELVQRSRPHALSRGADDVHVRARAQAHERRRGSRAGWLAGRSGTLGIYICACACVGGGGGTRHRDHALPRGVHTRARA